MADNIRKPFERNPCFEQLLFQFQNLNRFLVQIILGRIIFEGIYVPLPDRDAIDFDEVLQHRHRRLGCGNLLFQRVNIGQACCQIGARFEDAAEIFVPQLLPRRPLQRNAALAAIKNRQVDCEGRTQCVHIRSVARAVQTETDLRELR